MKASLQSRVAKLEAGREVTELPNAGLLPVIVAPGEQPADALQRALRLPPYHGFSASQRLRLNVVYLSKADGEL